MLTIEIVSLAPYKAVSVYNRCELRGHCRGVVAPHSSK